MTRRLSKREKSILRVTRQRGGAAVSDNSRAVRRLLIAGLVYRDDDHTSYTAYQGPVVTIGRYRATSDGILVREELA